MADNKYEALKKKKNNCFDTFLCHNSKDKAQVLELFNDLLDVGVLPWIDEKELTAGTSLVDGIGRAVEPIPSAVIVLGEEGFGQFQEEEYKNLLYDRTYNKKKIIPVILKNTKTPDIPFFLRDTLAIDFRMDGKDNFGKLYKGITGQDLVRPRVFVAEVSPETPLETKRNELKNFLQQFKITVLPQHSNVSDPYKVEKRIEDCLSQTDIFVQLLNAYGWLRLGSDKCLVKTQLTCAQRLLGKEKIFLWCAPEEFENIQLEDNTRITTGRFEDFKYQIRNAASQAVNKKKNNAGKTITEIFVSRDKTDVELTNKIFSLLQQKYKGISIYFNPDFKNQTEKLKFLKSLIPNCTIFIIVYAQSDASWVYFQRKCPMELGREKLPIVIIKNPGNKEEWLLDEFVSYVPYDDETDINNLIDTIDKILETANG